MAEGEGGEIGSDVQEIYRKPFEDLTSPEKAPEIKPQKKSKKEKEGRDYLRLSPEARKVLEGSKVPIHELDAGTAGEFAKRVKAEWDKTLDVEALKKEAIPDLEVALKLNSKGIPGVWQHLLPDQIDDAMEPFIEMISEKVPGAVGIRPSVALVLALIDSKPSVFARAEVDNPLRIRTGSVSNGHPVSVEIYEDDYGGLEREVKVIPQSDRFPGLSARAYMPVVSKAAAEQMKASQSVSGSVGSRAAN